MHAYVCQLIKKAVEPVREQGVEDLQSGMDKVISGTLLNGRSLKDMQDAVTEQCAHMNQRLGLGQLLLERHLPALEEHPGRQVQLVHG
jgi:hypothetical protein